MSDLFNFNIPEWIFVLVNLLILVFVLTRILWKPVIKILDERRAKLDKSLEDALRIEADRAAMGEQRAAFEDELEQRVKEAMKEARTRAGLEYDRIVAAAESKAAQTMSAARAQAERDRDSLLNDARAEIVSTVIKTAAVLLEANMDSGENERLIASFLERQGVSV